MLEDELVAELRRQGFSIGRESNNCKSATKIRGMIFKTLWSVRWRAKSQRVEKVWGVYGIIAP
jgi:hypothetical protein